MKENLEGMLEVAIEEEMLYNESEALEAMNPETFDDAGFISDIDEVRTDETAEIMAEVFSRDVLESWAEMSLEEKSSKLNEYYIKAGANLGIETKGVIVEPLESEQPGMISFGYNSGDGYIHINENVLNEPTYLAQVLDTATHEMRHQFQNDVLASPENFTDIPQNVFDTWEYEMQPENYISPDYDYQGYYEQAIECDARGFAENVLDSYTQKMNLN